MDPIKYLRPTSLVFIALLALPCSLALAQEEPAAKTVRPAKADYDTISIDFPGGPVSKLVASLNKEELSIIQSVGVDPVLPAFSVRNVRVEAVIVALDLILQPQGYILTKASPLVGTNLAVLSKHERRTSQAFASFQLDSKIGPFPGQASADDIVAAIKQGCEFASEGKPSTLRFKYHPATKLLFVAGTEQEVDVAHRVFGSLPNVNQELNAQEKLLLRSIPPEKNPPDKK